MQTPPLCVTIHMQHAPRHCKIYGETKRRCVLKKDVFLSGEQLHEKAGKGACIAQGTLKDSNDIHSSQCVVCVCLLQYSGRERETRLHRMHASSFLSYRSLRWKGSKNRLGGYVHTWRRLRCGLLQIATSRGYPPVNNHKPPAETPFARLNDPVHQKLRARRIPDGARYSSW